MRHKFTSEEAKKAGKKGGLSTKKKGKKYFSKIGKKGLVSRWKKFSTEKMLRDKESLL